MKAEDRKKLLALYEERYDRFGYDVRTVGWKDTVTQRLRFDVLTGIDDLSGCSICDLGCGFGDLYPYLVNSFKGIKYVGLDLSEKLIGEARKRYPDADFRVDDIMNLSSKLQVDYVLSSGALSFKVHNHEQYVQEMLASMMAVCTKGIAVNFLTSYVDYELDKNFHFSPEKAFTMASKLTRHITIRHDYPLYEFTLYLYRKAREK